MPDTNLNARVTQLALEVSHYEQKQQEAWDMVAQLSENWLQGQTFDLSLSLQGSPQIKYSLTFSFCAQDDIAAQLFTKLYHYYRAKALATTGLLASLKQVETLAKE